MGVKAICANLDSVDVNAGSDAEILERTVIVVTMTGTDMARIRAALTVLTDIGGSEIRNQLMPLLAALDTIDY